MHGPKIGTFSSNQLSRIALVSHTNILIKSSLAIIVCIEFSFEDTPSTQAQPLIQWLHPSYWVLLLSALKFIPLRTLVLYCFAHNPLMRLATPRRSIPLPPHSVLC